MSTNDELLAAMQQVGDDVHLNIKAVPGASRQRVMGMLGNRLKVTVKAAAQQGKANEAVCELLANAFDLPPANVSVIKGHTQPLKTLLLRQVSVEAVCDRLQTQG